MPHGTRGPADSGLPVHASDATRAAIARRPEVAPPNARRVLRGQWPIIVSCVLVVAITAFAVTALLPREYEATTTIRIDETQGGLQPLEMMERSDARSDVVTEMEALRSRTLAEAVIDSLGVRLVVTAPPEARRSATFSSVFVDSVLHEGTFRLVRAGADRFRLDSGEAHVPLGEFSATESMSAGGVTVSLAPRARALDEIEFTVSSLADAVEEVQEVLEIERAVRDANIVLIRFRSTDPELARNLPNAIADRFMSRRQSVRQRGARSTVAFLRGQLERLSGQLSDAEDSLRSFREHQRVVNPDEEGRTQLSRAADVRAQIGQLEAERSSLATLLQEVDSASRDRTVTVSPYRNLVAFPSLLRNQAAAQLLSSLSTVEDRRAELLTRRSLQDPDVQQLTARVGELEQQLWALTDTYLKGLTNQIRSLERNLARSDQQLGRLPAREVEFARLQRESKLLGDLYSLLQTRLKESEIAAASSDAKVQLLDPATLPRRPVSPRPVLNVALGIVVGLLLGIAVAFARAFVDRSVRSREDLQAVAGVPVLGVLPHIRAAGRVTGARVRPDDAARVQGREVSSPKAKRTTLPAPALAPRPFIEACHRLAANLAFAGAGRVRTVAVTSSVAGEGKTSVSTNLALISAQRGLRVLLIDADLRRGVIHSLLGAPRTPGIADVLEGRIALDAAIRGVDVSPTAKLHFLTTGTLPENPAQLLASSAMRGVMDELSGHYDLIIFDTPPVNIVADAALIGTLAERVLVVARAGVTTLDGLTYALEQIRLAGAPVVGAVLNDIDTKTDETYGGSHDYYTREAPPDAGTQEAELATR